MIRGVTIALGLVSLMAMSSCDEGGYSNLDSEERDQPADRGRPLSRAELERLGFPVYWAGPNYRGLKVSAIRLFEKRRVKIGYGKRRCEPGSGCLYPASVFSQRARGDVFPVRTDTPDGFGGVCFRKIGRAVQVSCLDADQEDGEDILLTGNGAVIFDSIDPADLRSVTPPRGHEPLPPKRLTCAEISGMPHWARRKVPDSLAASKRCG